MRQVVCRELGPLEGLVIVDGPDPEPSPGGVVLAVEAAGVNYVDALFVQGKYQIKPPVPFTPGMEVAGTVAAVGDGVTGWSVGDRVMAMTGLGGYADRIAVPALALSRVPDNLALPAAAAFIQSYCTALFSLTVRTTVTAEDTVVVLGAGGGVGQAAVDVASALGATVIAAASTAGKRAAAVALGATHVLDYDAVDLKTAVRGLTDGGADVIVDPVGGPYAEPALRSLRRFGRYLVIGFAAGPIPTIPLNQVLLNNRTVLGVDWGAWTFVDGAGQRALLDRLLAMVADGHLHPPAPDCRPLDSVVDALHDLLERRVTGKLVLTP